MRTVPAPQTATLFHSLPACVSPCHPHCIPFLPKIVDAHIAFIPDQCLKAYGLDTTTLGAPGRPVGAVDVLKSNINL